jgi:hypothetical protein
MPEPCAVVEVKTPRGSTIVEPVALDEAWMARIRALQPPAAFFAFANDRRFPTLPTPMARQLWKAVYPDEPAPWHDGISGELPRLCLTLADLDRFAWDPERNPQLVGTVLPRMRALAQEQGVLPDAVRLEITFDVERDDAAS